MSTENLPAGNQGKPGVNGSRRYFLVVLALIIGLMVYFLLYKGGGRPQPAPETPVPQAVTETAAQTVPAAPPAPQPQPEPAQGTSPAPQAVPVAPPPGAAPAGGLEIQRLWVVESKPDQTILGLLFPATMRIEDVASHVSVAKPDGTKVTCAVGKGEDDRTFRLMIAGPPDRNLSVLLSEGLQDAGKTLIGSNARTYNFPKELPLSVTSANWQSFAWNQLTVAIQFSKPVSSELLAQHLSFKEPGSEAVIPFDVLSPGDSASHVVELHPEGFFPVNVLVNITEGLRSTGEEVLGPAYSKTITGRVLQLAIEDTYWYAGWYRGGGGKNGLILNVRLNKPVKSAELPQHVEFSPAIEGMRVEPSSMGFQVCGDWNSRQSYEIKITPGLTDAQGLVLAKPVIRRVTSETVPAYVGFAREGEYYFPRRPGLALPLETRNLDKATITLYRMFSTNIAVALSDMEQGQGSERFNEAWSQEVARKEVAVANRPDRIVQTPIDLDAVFPPDKKGVFCIKASGTETILPNRQRQEEESGEEFGYQNPRYANRVNTKLVLWTDLGVLAYWQKNELALFVHDLFSLAPLSLAKVTVYSHKNQVLGTANTDDNGIARLASLDPALGSPRVAVVEREGDFTFLDLTPRQDDLRPFTEDMPHYNRKGYDAFIYADRDLYRPGETVHAHWLVRTNYGDALANVPLLVTVLKPNGRTVLSQPTTLGALGTGGIDVSTEKIYPTGKYTVQLAVPGNKNPVGTYQFSLEEFVPNRMKTTVNIEQTRWLAGQTYPIRVNAQHLFGAPASDRKSEAIVIFKRGGFEPQAWKGFRFDNDSEFIPEPVPCGDLRTDDAGNAAFSFSYKPPKKVTFPMKAIVVGRVFELGGRPVTAKTEGVFFPSDICLGISASRAQDGKGIEVFAAAVTPDEKPATLAKVNVTLERQVWNYYVRRYYTSHEPRWSESFEPVETREVNLVDGKGSTVFAPHDYGYYRVRVHAAETPQFSTVSFYSYWESFQLVDAARPSLIKVSLDKETCQVGDQAVIRVESPFDGKGIIVVQGEEIQDMIPIEIKDKAGEARLNVGPKQVPNVWVEVTVIHAIKADRKQVYPFSSFAMANLKVRDLQRQLTVAFPNLPKEIRPAGEARFEVAVADAAGKPAEAELTLAAVDEGIHAITSYQSPDPFAWLFRPRQPDFRRTHYYDKVAYDFDKPAIGGDALLRDVQKRLPAADENWIRPVALWSGTVRTDASGRAVVAMNVPEFSGQLRLAAVACTAGAVGAHSDNVFVRRPYMLRTSMPRFLLTGDTVRCRASVFNNSDAPCKARLSWSFGGALRGGAGSQDLDVAAHGEADTVAEFVAGQSPGQAEIRWEAVVLDAAGQEVDRLKEVAPIPVRPPATFETRHDAVVLKPGETREIRNTAYLDDERTELALTVGASPLLRIEAALKYVVGYPYGCVEQTTSRLMPMYLLRKNKDLLGATLDEQTTIDNYIQAGITRLFSMQTTAGGFGVWPGSNVPYDYGSVYALHFLTMIKNGREFDLPAENFEALQQYVRRLAKDWTKSGESNLFLRAYALYVLAVGGDLDAIQQIQRFDTIQVPRHARFLLAAALARNTQDADRVKLYLSTAPSQPYTIMEPDKTLNSDIRNTAIEMMALEQMGGPPEQVLERANALVDFLEKHHYGTTQENAFIITALADYLTGVEANISAASATISGPDRQETLSGPKLYRISQRGPKVVFTVANTGTVDLFVNVTTGGVPEKVETTEVKEGGLSVTRTLRTSRGEPCNTTVFPQTGSFVVDLAIACEKGFKNLVTADLLPAGFEIENPRLDTDSLPPGTFPDAVLTPEQARKKHRPHGEEEEEGPGAVTVSYLDVRDDRMVAAFDSLPKGTHHFYYVVRAVTPGTYQYPPVTGECMYDAGIRSKSGAAVIEIK